MIRAKLEGLEFVSLGTFSVAGTACSVVRDYVVEEDALARLTFEIGPGFKTHCMRLVEIDVHILDIEILCLDEMLRFTEATHLLGERWKPMSICSVFNLLTLDKGAEALKKTSSATYFRISHESFKGIVFLTPLDGKNNWFVDAVPEDELEAISWLDPTAQFGIPA